MKRIDTSTFHFPGIIAGDLLYVDKTAYIPKLLDTSKECILSRLRRFGKSLLVSTLKALFQGRRYFTCQSPLLPGRGSCPRLKALLRHRSHS